MRYFIDTEFDGYRGALLSLALVREDGEARYWVLEDYKITDTWVKEHVYPYLYKGPVETVETEADLSREIARFMKHDDDPEVVADWPDDIKYFCDVIVFGPGKCRNLKKVRFEFNRDFGDYVSEVPHNAYYDAKAIYEKWKISKHII